MNPTYFYQNGKILFDFTKAFDNWPITIDGKIITIYQDLFILLRLRLFKFDSALLYCTAKMLYILTF